MKVKINLRNQGIRLRYLDELRGFAALYVVLYHLLKMSNASTKISIWIEKLIGYGGSGVTIFFVLSGFSMALTWPKYISSSSPIKNFYIARIFRIVPLFYFWIIISLARDYIFKSGDLGVHQAKEILINFLFIFNLIKDYQYSVVWAGWTIGVEMIFYLIFPEIKKYLHNSLKKLLLLIFFNIAIVIIFVNKNELFTGVEFFIFIPTFLSGMFIYIFFRKIKKINNKISKITLVIGILGVIYLIYSRKENLYFYYLSVFFYSVIIYGISERGYIFKEINALKFTGKISYSIYLNHPSIIYILRPVYSEIEKSNLTGDVVFAICSLLTMAIVIPISCLTYYFIEKPFIHMGKNYINKLS